MTSIAQRLSVESFRQKELSVQQRLAKPDQSTFFSRVVSKIFSFDTILAATSLTFAYYVLTIESAAKEESGEALTERMCSHLVATSPDLWPKVGQFFSNIVTVAPVAAVNCWDKVELSPFRLLEVMKSAVSKGAGKFIDLYAQSNFNPNAAVSASDSQTALGLALEEGNLEVFTALLKHPDIGPDVGNLLFDAARLEDKAFLSALLAHPKIDVNAQDVTGNTPLRVAIRRKDAEVVSALLAHPKIVVNTHDTFGEGHLITAVRNDNVEMVSALLAHPKFDVNAQDELSYTPLMVAIMRKDTEVVFALLAHPEIDVNVPGLLKEAIIDGNAEIVSALLAHPKIDVNAQDTFGEVHLVMAIRYSDAEMVSALLAHPKIDVNAQDATGNTPLVLAIKRKDKKTIFALLAHPKIDVNAPDGAGEKPITAAIGSGSVEIVSAVRAHPKMKLR